MELKSINDDIAFHQKMILMLTQKKLDLISTKKPLIRPKPRKEKVSKPSEQPNDYNRLLIRRIQAMNQQKNSDKSIEMIRKKEKELIDDGMEPNEARELVKKQVYPESISECPKSNNLVKQPKENEIEEDADDLFKSHDLINKLESLGMISDENHNKEDIVSETVIYEE